MVCGVSYCFGAFSITAFMSTLWKDYALLDSGDGEKCERFGDVVMIRPEPQALWPKADPQAAVWRTAPLVYARDGREGEWYRRERVADRWTIGWEDLRFSIRPTSFKHTGLFPEQEANWQWLRTRLTPGARVLNLFGYTGGATLACASVGCDVTHVDASKPVVTWGRENLELSGLAERSVRWIVDDAQKFVAREIRRGSVYDAILMDPPAFGRGPEGEIWKFEEHVPKLLEQCQKLLAPQHGILLVNAYSLGFSAKVIENVVRTFVPDRALIASTDLLLTEQTSRAFALPAGVAVRATW